MFEGSKCQSDIYNGSVAMTTLTLNPVITPFGLSGSSHFTTNDVDLVSGNSTPTGAEGSENIK